MSTQPKKEAMREAMPETAAWVDQLRQALGAERIDAAIRAGQQAQRHYTALQQSHGQGAADQWLKRQKFPAGCFYASENGHTVGIQRG
jgi:hypothetical protein